MSWDACGEIGVGNEVRQVSAFQPHLSLETSTQKILAIRSPIPYALHINSILSDVEE